MIEPLKMSSGAMTTPHFASSAQNINQNSQNQNNIHLFSTARELSPAIRNSELGQKIDFYA